jgi:sodium/bile acid cotransporter 7
VSILERILPRSEQAKRKKIDRMYERSRKRFPDIPEVSAEELKRMMEKDDVVLVDVRRADEQASSMLPRAIPVEAFRKDLAQYADAKIVAYCTSGRRSGLFVQTMSGSGLDLSNLKGSILAWTHAGGPLTCAGGPTRKVHVHGRRTNLIAKGYEAVW